MRLKNFLLISLSLFLLCGTAFAGTVSLDNVFVANDQYAADFYSKLNRNFSQILTGGVNNVESANIANDTLLEADMADEINPRIRFYEMGGDGTECEMVYEGLLPVTDSDLTTDTSAGTAYVRGYRINKAAATSHSYTASKWTFVDLSSTGDFSYSEVAIGAATPAVAANSMRLARVSSDGTTINTVTDLRVTNCTDAKFSTIKEVTTEASLDDILKNGAPVKKTFGSTWATSTPDGFAQGAIISWASHTSLSVSSGGLYINGKYRVNSTATTVPQTADDPTNGVSGAVTSIAASTTHNIYAVADQSDVKTFSVSIGTAPTGLTNSRVIGSILTDGSSLFTSQDVYTAHAVTKNDFNDMAPKGWIFALGAATPASYDASYNVASLTDTGAGDWTVVWDTDFASGKYCVVTGNDENIATLAVNSANQAAGSVQITGAGANGRFHVAAYGDQ